MKTRAFSDEYLLADIRDALAWIIWSKSDASEKNPKNPPAPGPRPIEGTSQLSDPRPSPEQIEFVKRRLGMKR
ncbi:DUF5361 domain-containing protein [Bifidobacterium psychraerophilum]|uniref:DUF5361 domain-containing protein n=1 Tax=Bifidobacterium psychraerophilum TaxID=218140 RepID=UPI0039EB64FE